MRIQLSEETPVRRFGGDTRNKTSEDYRKQAVGREAGRSTPRMEVGAVAGTDDVYVRTAGDALRHRAPWMVAVVLASVLVGVLLSRSAPHLYQADASLYISVSKQGLAADFSDGVLTRYYLQQATSPEVLRRAGKALGGESPGTVAGRVTANAINGANVIVIRGQATRPQEAIRRANAVAGAMIEKNQADASGRLHDSRAYLSDELTRLDVALRQPGRPAKELDVLRNQYLTTYTRLQDLNLEQTRTADGLTLLQAASSAEPQTGIGSGYLIGALVVGLCLAAFTALVMERFDDRLRRPEGLAQAAGIRMVLRIRGRSSVPTPGSEQLYGLAFAQLAAAHPNARGFMVVAASPREPDSAARVGTGLAAGSGGAPATLIRADFLPTSRSPTVASSAALDRSIEEARKAGRAVVAVSSPLALTTAAAVARPADIAIIVATAGRTRFQDARNTASALRQVGVEPVAGVLLSRRAGWRWPLRFGEVL